MQQALTMMFVMFFPRNVFMTFIHSELLLQYRVLLVIGLTIWLGVMSVKRKAETWGMS